MSLRPEIRIGLLRFSGREAIRTQRWSIAFLVVAKATLMFSLAAVVWLSVLKPEVLHSDFYTRLLTSVASK
jgi:hypothetical protein